MLTERNIRKEGEIFPVRFLCRWCHRFLANNEKTCLILFESVGGWESLTSLFLLCIYLCVLTHWKKFCLLVQCRWLGRIWGSRDIVLQFYPKWIEDISMILLWGLHGFFWKLFFDVKISQILIKIDGESPLDKFQL